MPNAEALALVQYLCKNRDDDAAWLAYADAIDETHKGFAEHLRATRGNIVPALTAFGGLLTREKANRYVWKDGTVELRALDGAITSDHLYPLRDGHVVVPSDVLLGRESLQHMELDFVSDGCDLGWYNLLDLGAVLTVLSDGVTPGNWSSGRRLHLKGRRDLSVLVPSKEWLAHAKALPNRIFWYTKDEEAVLDKARSLGWKGDTWNDEVLV